MDHTNPLSVVTPTLDGPVLSALAATTGSSTGAHVHRMAGVGSADGVRRVLARLVTQGVVLAEEHAHATLYRLNRDHVAAPAILELTRLRARIFSLLQSTIADWKLRPVHASVFGSFASSEAVAESNIDILLVAAATEAANETWTGQVDELARAIRLWTGNDAHIISVTPVTLSLMVQDDDPLVASWRSETIHLSGMPLMDLIRSLTFGADPVPGSAE